MSKDRRKNKFLVQSPLGENALLFIDSFFTSEEIKASNLRVDSTMKAVKEKKSHSQKHK